MKTESIIKDLLKECKKIVRKDKVFNIDLDESGEIPSSFAYGELEDYMSFQEWDSEDGVDTPECKIVFDFKNVLPDVFDDVFNEKHIEGLIDVDNMQGETKRWKKRVRHEDDYDSEYFNPTMKVLETNKNSKLITVSMEYHL